MNEVKDAFHILGIAAQDINSAIEKTRKKPKIMKYFCVVSIWYDRHFYKTLTAEEIEMYKNNGYKVNVQALRIVR